MEKMTGESLDLTQENIKRLKELFPEVLTEKKIDFDKLRLILGDEVEASPERYEFRWNGKNEAIKLSQTPSMGTLRPDKESSKNWDTTENLYIEGDNLEVLKLLQKGYFGKIKMIYIDPPYNTGKDFIYKDNFRDNIANYKEITNQSTKANPETNGRFHTDWLNMIYARVKLARNLLMEDGFFAVSIADEEVFNLKKILDEIFGECNFRNNLLVRRYDKNINNQFTDKGLKTLNVGSEYILIYSKSEKSLLNAVYREASDERKSQGYWKSFWNDADRPTMRYNILNVLIEDGQWKWRKEVADEAVNNYNCYIQNYSDKMTLEDYWMSTGEKLKFIRRRDGLNGKNKGVEHWVAPSKGILRSSNWNDLLVSESISKYGLSFSSPKNPKLIKELVQMLTNEDDIIIDFFSGSASTAHAIFDLNNENFSSRKFILVQIPEKTKEASDAFKQGYLNICEIGKERIRRVGDKIVEEFSNNRIDIGFKVFKLDDSNIKTWDPNTRDLENTLFNSVQNLKEDRTQEDLLYELMLKMGIELTAKIEEVNVDGKIIYNIQSGGLVICLEDEITKEVIDYIPNLKSPFIDMKVVFKEYGFKSDANKLNAIQNLKQHGILDVRSV